MKDGPEALDAEPTIGEKESAEMEMLIKSVAGGPADRAGVITRGGLSTQAVHGGERAKGGFKARATLDALTTPIVQTATFTFRNTAEIVGYNEGTYDSFEYGRYGNPTVRAAEEKIMTLEGAEDCIISASGMSAVTTMLLALVDTVSFAFLSDPSTRFDVSRLALEIG
jgi:cystathionine beta-lyase/cystathionine gamma-synthase